MAYANPDKLKNCALFLGINQISGVESSAVFAGTGFFVAVEYEGELFAYIVTARHVIEDMRAFRRRYPKPEHFIRLNDHTGEAFQALLGDSTWVISEDPMVDLAYARESFQARA